MAKASSAATSTASTASPASASAENIKKPPVAQMPAMPSLVDAVAGVVGECLQLCDVVDRSASLASLGADSLDVASVQTRLRRAGLVSSVRVIDSMSIDDIVARAQVAKASCGTIQPVGAATLLNGWGDKFNSLPVANVKTTQGSTALIFDGLGMDLHDQFQNVLELVKTLPFAKSLWETMSVYLADTDVDVHQSETWDQTSPLIQLPIAVLGQLCAVHVMVSSRSLSWGFKEVSTSGGHSLGFLTAALVCTGVSDEYEFLKRAELAIGLCTRIGRAICKSFKPASWNLLVLDHDINAIRDRVLSRNEITVTVVNTPTTCIITGSPQALDSFADELASEDILNQFPDILFPVHSPRLSVVEGELKACAELSNLFEGRTLPSDCALICSSNGKPVSQDDDLPTVVLHQFLSANCNWPETLQAIAAFQPRSVLLVGNHEHLSTWFGWHPCELFECHMLRGVMKATESARSVAKHGIPSVDCAQLDIDFKHIDPCSAGEATVRDCFAAVLGLSSDTISTDRSFFELGGSSLKAMRLSRRISQAIGHHVHLVDVLRQPTVAQLASAVANQDNDEPRAFRKNSSQTGARLVEVSIGVAQVPCSSMQHQLLLHHELQPMSTAYNEPVLIVFSVELTEPVVRASIQALARRHAVLRTHFGIDVDKATFYQTVHCLDGRYLPLAQSAEPSLWSEALDAELRAPFALRAAPPIRAIHMSGVLSRLCIVVHHVAADMEAMATMRAEVLAHCEALASRLSPPRLGTLEVEYVEFACWESACKHDQAALDWWTSHLKGAQSLINLPRDRDRPALQATSASRVEVQVELDPKPLCSSCSCTLHSALLSLWAALLFSHCQQEGVVIGVPHSMRYAHLL